MKQKITLLWILPCFLVLTACVSQKKYKAKEVELANAQSSNADLTKKNSDLQTQLNDAIASNKLLADEHAKYQADCEKVKADYKEVQDQINAYVTSAADVQKKLEAGMADFAERGVDVDYKNGLVYVNMEDELLFKSGSSKISKDGETALATLAPILNDYPNVKVYVVGNTDDQKMRGGDNWTLSTERANNVVRKLKDLKVDPARLTSAGRASFDPVADNTTPEGRAKNRRIQIILNPELIKALDKAMAN